MLMVLLLASLLASCGRREETSDTTSQLQTFKDLDALNEALDNQRVYCGVPGNACPGYAAKLAFWYEADATKYYLGVCSGTLYQNRYIITNSHCIPPEIKRAGALCSDQIRVLFPNTNQYISQNARCSRVIQAYQQDQGQPDIAVIELDKNVYREEIRISKNSFVENSKVYAYTMNPSSYDKTVGTITQKKCTLTTDNAFFMSTSQSSNGAVLYGNDCNVISGNSGSGLFNERGEYLGAVFAKVEMTALYELFAKKRINHAMTGPMGIVQNIGCLGSITSNSGIACSPKNNTASEVDSFINRMKMNANLSTENEALINYELSDGFQLKLTKAKSFDSLRTVDSFRQKWNELFVEKTSSLSSNPNIIRR